MESRKLTKEDIDKVRDIEGFPIGTDEDIIALSNAPYYTACPNPFIEDFINKYGTPYIEETDNYHREPFTADVSEGKHDTMYMAHSYHTKVPYRAIMRYILNYTKPGDIVLDGFSGTGMTGVAAQMCGTNDFLLQNELRQSVPYFEWGSRYAILSDLSPEAAFLSYNYNVEYNVAAFSKKANDILNECRKECEWMYMTKHDNCSVEGKIVYVVWSDVYICPNCGRELNLWDISVLEGNKVLSKPKCPDCAAVIDKNKCEHAQKVSFDPNVGSVVSMAKQVPVKIFYSYQGKRYSKVVEQTDVELIEKIMNTENPYWFPSNRMREGSESRRNDRTGVTHVHHFYTKRNLYVLSKCYDLIQKEDNERLKHILMFWFSSIYSRSHKLNRYMPNHNRHVGPLSGTLYMPYFQTEINILGLLKDKLKAIKSVKGMESKVVVTNQSTSDLRNIPDGSIDYIFTDPPFGDNLNYSELNAIWESWLKCQTQNNSEAVINKSQSKGLFEYQTLMTKCFEQYYRVLKPNRWMTVEFHNSKNAVWNAIQEAIQQVGFVIADVRTLDKQKGTTKQLSTTSAVKQDLVISAYKPKESFKKKFLLDAGTEETVWDFVRQYLDNIAVVVIKDGKIELIAERQAFLLFDRMIAYHIMNGISVPIDSADFYRGLDEKFLKRDSMYFIADQVNEYDIARIKNEVEPIQISLFVSNEKTAISWLYQQLEVPKTYSELMPKFMQEVKSVDKFEAMPELAVMLEENFLQNDKGQWYIPDRTKEGDIVKLREKKLWKEFEGYMNSKGKLKLFRSEAVRVGFSKLWKDKNYQAIVDIAKRLPEKTIQEDPNLLMYYDISLSRV
jgi:DNA modification methylase/DNA-directed RNA polymerase subunit RPC12/RpoP